MNIFKALFLISLVTFTGCFSVEKSHDGKCVTLVRTDQVCVYQGTFYPGFECPKLKHIKFDDKVLPIESYTIQCGVTDEDSVITITNPPHADCNYYFVEGCID